MRRLIVNADDFGFTPAVTAGILEAHAAGSVTATSMMVHCPGWDDGVKQARAMPSLEYGLHLNLLVGAPIAKVPSLTDWRSGQFLPLTKLVRRSVLRQLRLDDVMAECEAQLAALRIAGIRCTHIDSHRHTHALPVVHRAIAAVANTHGLALRRPVESHLRVAGGFASQVHRGLIGMSWRISATSAARTKSADHFAGLSMQGNPDFEQRFLGAVNSLAPGTTEIMVHPGRVDAVLRSTDGYTWERERELAALTSPAVRERLGRGDIALIGFAALQ